MRSTLRVDRTALVGQPNNVSQAEVLPRIKAADQPGRRGPMLRGFQRITGQRIVLGGSGAPRAECTVFGRLHRRDVEQRVTLAVALELARDGVPTVVRAHGD